MVWRRAYYLAWIGNIYHDVVPLHFSLLLSQLLTFHLQAAVANECSSQSNKNKLNIPVLRSINGFTCNCLRSFKSGHTGKMVASCDAISTQSRDNRHMGNKGFWAFTINCSGIKEVQFLLHFFSVLPNGRFLADLRLFLSSLHTIPSQVARQSYLHAFCLVSS